MAAKHVLVFRSCEKSCEELKAAGWTGDIINVPTVHREYRTKPSCRKTLNPQGYEFLQLMLLVEFWSSHTYIQCHKLTALIHTLLTTCMH